MANAPTIRTAEGLHKVIKALDPDTALTLNAIRTMVKDGRIPSIEVGKKKLIDVECALKQLGFAGKDIADDLDFTSHLGPAV